MYMYYTDNIAQNVLEECMKNSTMMSDVKISKFVEFLYGYVISAY